MPDCLQAEPVPTTMLTVEQTAERLQVPPRDVAKLIAAGAIGYCRIAGKVRIHPQCLADYLDKQTIKPWART